MSRQSIPVAQLAGLRLVDRRHLLVSLGALTTAGILSATAKTKRHHDGGNRRTKRRRHDKRRDQQAREHRSADGQAEANAQWLNNQIYLASHQTHGFADDRLAPNWAVMESIIQSGKRLFVSCGHIAELGRRQAAADGKRARLAMTVTREAWHGDDGHVLLEVWNNGAWRTFDLDGNRRTNRSLIQLCGGQRDWTIIATDQPVKRPGEQVWWDTIDAWYDRVLQVPLYYEDPYAELNQSQICFNDESMRGFLESRGYKWVDATRWQQLVAG
jgi:hypothetical protein